LYALPVICLRFFTVYGPRQRPDLAIHKYTKLMKSGLPIPVFGDGTSGRDYTYIDDITAGIVAAIDFETDFEIFNLGNNRPVILRDLIAILGEIIGVRPELQFLPTQPGDVPLTWAEISKANQLLRYSPETSLRDGLRQFVTWFDSAKPAAVDLNEYASFR
jgi:UDP-glucuronate 4-epimerase